MQVFCVVLYKNHFRLKVVCFFCGGGSYWNNYSTPHKLVDVARVKQFSMIISREQLYTVNWKIFVLKIFRKKKIRVEKFSYSSYGWAKLITRPWRSSEEIVAFAANMYIN